jgi:hypothetical protein
VFILLRHPYIQWSGKLGAWNHVRVTCVSDENTQSSFDDGVVRISTEEDFVLLIHHFSNHDGGIHRDRQAMKAHGHVYDVFPDVCFNCTKSFGINLAQVMNLAIRNVAIQLARFSTSDYHQCSSCIHVGCVGENGLDVIIVVVISWSIAILVGTHKSEVPNREVLDLFTNVDGHQHGNRCSWAGHSFSESIKGLFY